MKKRIKKLLIQKLIGIGVMISSVPVFHIMERELMWPIILILIGFWVLTRNKLLSEISSEEANKEVNEDLK